MQDFFSFFYGEQKNETVERMEAKVSVLKWQLQQMLSENENIKREMQLLLRENEKLKRRRRS
jgi:cell division protein FtsB